MARSKLPLEKTGSVPCEEDDETLAAIDAGLREADAGHLVTMEEVRKLLPDWITASASRRGR